VDHEDLVGTGELHHAREEAVRHDRARRVVRIVEVHQLRAVVTGQGGGAL